MGTTTNAIPVRLERGEPADVLIMVGYALTDLAGELKAPLLGLYGGKDGGIKVEDVQAAAAKAKAAKAKALGADHVINYRKDRFSTITRKLTNKKGVDVVFEHVGGEGFNESLLVLKRGGRLVTCGSTAGPSITFNLMQLFQQQYKIFGSFGASMKNIRESLDKMAAGMLPVIDTEVTPENLEVGLQRLESRQVFGKIIVNF